MSLALKHLKNQTHEIKWSNNQHERMNVSARKMNKSIKAKEKNYSAWVIVGRRRKPGKVLSTNKSRVYSYGGEII